MVPLFTLKMSLFLEYIFSYKSHQLTIPDHSKKEPTVYFTTCNALSINADDTVLYIHVLAKMYVNRMPLIVWVL